MNKVLSMLLTTLEKLNFKSHELIFICFIYVGSFESLHYGAHQLSGTIAGKPLVKAGTDCQTYAIT